MENFEKYIDEILNADACVMRTVLSEHSCVVPCCKENCNMCIKDSKEWLLAEYEPPVDWSKVPVDTKILVSDYGTIWLNRHFAKFENGFVCAWNGGETSWSAGKYGDVKSWQYAKLAEDGESE